MPYLLSAVGFVLLMAALVGRCAARDKNKTALWLYFVGGVGLAILVVAVVFLLIG